MMDDGSVAAPYTKNYFDVDVPKTIPSKKAGLVARTVMVGKRRTSIRIEAEIWDAIRFIVRNENATQAEVLEIISKSKPKETSFSSAIRVFTMLYFRAASTKDGHRMAGHGDINLMKMRMGLHKNTFCRD